MGSGNFVQQQKLISFASCIASRMFCSCWRLGRKRHVWHRLQPAEQSRTQQKYLRSAACQTQPAVY